jgi:glutathione peroxidase
MLNFIKFLSLLLISIFSFNQVSFSKNLSIDKTIFKDIDGKEFILSNLPGKIILVVNTASNCGFTRQYKELQELTSKYSSKELSIIAIPSNDFGNQEPGSDEEIKDFCESRYGITFPVMSKQKVIGNNKHSFYTWVEENYGSKKLPSWNFHKYLINRNGELLHSMSSHVSPTSKKFINNIEASLK